MDEFAISAKGIEGQITEIRRMHEEGRYLDQLAAARAGLGAVGLLLLERHVDGCVREALEDGNGPEKAIELVSVVRRFVRSV